MYIIINNLTTEEQAAALDAMQQPFYQNFGFLLQDDKVMFKPKKDFWEGEERIGYPHMTASAMLQKEITLFVEMAKMRALFTPEPQIEC